MFLPLLSLTLLRASPPRVYLLLSQQALVQDQPHTVDYFNTDAAIFNQQWLLASSRPSFPHLSHALFDAEKQIKLFEIPSNLQQDDRDCARCITVTLYSSSWKYGEFAALNGLDAAMIHFANARSHSSTMTSLLITFFKVDCDSELSCGMQEPLIFGLHFVTYLFDKWICFWFNFPLTSTNLQAISVSLLTLFKLNFESKLL